MNIVAGPATVAPAPIVVQPPITVQAVAGGIRMWAGEGPPLTQFLSGVQVGETYLDRLSGNIYRLEPGQ